MNEKLKITPFMQIFIIGFLLGFLVCYTMPGRRDTNIAGTVSAIKEQQSIIKHEISNADNGVREAAFTVQEADRRITDSKRIAIENAERIDIITKIVRECNALAEENGRIIDSVGEANKSR